LEHVTQGPCRLLTALTGTITAVRAHAAQFDVFRDCPACADNDAMTARLPATLPDAPTAATTPWQATLQLRFARRVGEHGGTVLEHSRHQGPLRIQKALHPEGSTLCHAIVLHPPGGIAGGDQLAIDIELGADAQALLTTPGAGKWYRSAGALAEQRINLTVRRGATLEWLPQESIVFSGAQARMRTTVALEMGARYIGIDTLCLGRRASGETFSRGQLHLATDIRLAGQTLWRERGCLDGGSVLLDSPIGLAGFSVCSTVIAAGGDVSADTLAACRQATPTEAGANFGVTALPKLFVGRYLGHSAEAARAWFVELWRALRPSFVGRDMVVPRIWNT
jgi:urease accessory protein